MKRLVILSLVMLVSTVACGQQPAAKAEGEDSDIAARYGDQVVTNAELEEMVSAKVIALRQQEYDIKRQQLEQTVYERLVEQAGAAEGMSSSDYLKQHVTDKAGEPTEEEIEKVFAQYRSRLNPDEAKAREQVVGYLKQQQTASLSAALKDRLFHEAGVQILLDPIRFEPVVNEFNPARGGGEDAPVTIIEYTDFQCPFCSRVQPTLNEILETYGDSVRHVFKQLPLPMHPQARLGAEAALCAGDQGKFWEMHDWLFTNKNSINREAMTEQATVLEMDTEVFGTCLDEKKHDAQISEDMKEANGFGITGTPGFLINGRALRGAVPMDQFVQIINEELRRAGAPIPEQKAEEEAATTS